MSTGGHGWAWHGWACTGDGCMQEAALTPHSSQWLAAALQALGANLQLGNPPPHTHKHTRKALALHSWCANSECATAAMMAAPPQVHPQNRQGPQEPPLWQQRYGTLALALLDATHACLPCCAGKAPACLPAVLARPGIPFCCAGQAMHAAACAPQKPGGCGSGNHRVPRHVAAALSLRTLSP